MGNRKRPLVFLLTLVLAAGTARADGWLHDGMTICSTWQAGQLKPTGQGGAAGGISQTAIVCVDGNKVIGITSGFADLRGMGLSDPVPMPGNTCFTATFDQYTDLWISPAKLATLPNDPAHGSSVGPVQWKIPTGTVAAIEWVEQTPTSYSDHVFDARTGLCYHYSTRGASGAAAGGDFLGMRDLNIPWGNEAPPDWVKTVKALHYRGNTTVLGAMMNIPTTVAVDLTVTDRGDRWLTFNFSRETQIGNSQPIPASGQLACGNAQFGGFWAGPAALATLQQGQVLDQDPITLIKTVVLSATGNSVVIAEANQSGELDFQYDKQTGILTGSSFVNAQLKQKTVLQLVSKE